MNRPDMNRPDMNRPRYEPSGYGPSGYEPSGYETSENRKYTWNQLQNLMQQKVKKNLFPSVINSITINTMSHFLMIR